jgi:O-antigen/teichoic acid export membrane protein
MSQNSTSSRSVLREAFGTLIIRCVGILLMFASTTVAARTLHPADFGAYSTALSMALLLACIAPLGTDRILMRNVSNSDSLATTGAEIAIAHVCTAISSLILASGCLLFSGFSTALGYSGRWPTTLIQATLIFLPLALIYLRQWTAMPLIGSRRAVMPEQTIVPVAFILLMLAGLAVGLTPTAGRTCTMYATALMLVWALSFCSAKIRIAYLEAARQLPQVLHRRTLHRMIEGLPFVSVSIGAVWTQSCVALVVAAACGFAEAAYFSLAFPFAVLPAIPLGALNLSIMARCARHYHRGEFAQANHAVRSGATAAFVSGAGIALVTWLCSPLLIVFLGAKYTMVCQLLPTLLLAVLLECLTGPTLPVMQTMGMERTYAVLLFAFIPVQLALNYGFGRLAGVEGVAYGYLFSRLLWNLAVVHRIYSDRGLLMLPYLRPALALKKSLTDDSPTEQTGWIRPSFSDPATGMNEAQAA